MITMAYLYDTDSRGKGRSGVLSDADATLTYGASSLL
jgi:hypothetical protein